ncbi:hypothetical protein OMCYN_01830 [cyanobiont of Ornithocercus magnificus]|nr:hypothetical protein OMCYN_01830 [cyanobiont of Ornithocercus magnificus]
MSLLPRWEVMNDDVKAVVKRATFSVAVLLLSLWVIRTLIPWVIITLAGYWVYKWLSKSN